MEVLPAQVECTDSAGSDWQTEGDESFSISAESGSEDEDEIPERIVVERSLSRSPPQRPLNEHRSFKASPVRNPSVGTIKRLQPKILQPTKSSIIKKPIEVATFKWQGTRPVVAKPTR